MGGVNVGLRAVLALLGKRGHKVAAVFGVTPEPCHQAVMHLRAGAPEVPVWLFATTPPLPETAAACERVFVIRNSLLLFLQAQIRLWPYWVTIAVGTWTAEHGRWPLKLAPFLVPPFRALLLNSWGGFFPGRPALVWRHGQRSVLAGASSGWRRCKEIAENFWLLISFHIWRTSRVRRAREIAAGVWMLVFYHIWRSGPVRRVQDVAYGSWRLVSYHLWRSSAIRRARDIVRARAIRMLATVLGWCSHPHRVWFTRMHGDEALSVTEQPAGIPAGVGIDVFTQPTQSWDPHLFSDFVHASQARWILWRQSGEEKIGTDDLLALFNNPSTFAVARQSHVRGWKPALLPTAPFRALQPGTATQVLAPLGRTILLDRAKLALLGIPSAGLAETAWMLIFWKAAAAGWRSYSVPDGDAQSSLQPDFPAQEAEFYLRAVSDGELRRLGPRQPDLSQGTIVFAPSTQMRLRPDRLRVVLVSPFLPYPLAHGGAVRIFNLCRELADRVDFILIAFREAHDVVEYEQLRQVFRQVYTVDIDEHESPDTRLPWQVRTASSTSLRALIADVCKRVQPDLLQIEFTHMAAYRDSAPDVPAVLVEHDLTFNLYGQLARTDPSPDSWNEYQRWLDFERRWLAAYDGVWTMSSDDRRGAIHQGSHRARTYVVPNGVDIRRFVPCEAPTTSPEIFYVGSFRHSPNVLGFQKLRQEVMPRVWERFPGARLRVVAGPQHEFFWNKFAKSSDPMPVLDSDPRIEIQAYVEDLRPLYARSSLVVVPLEVSAGTNIKVLEAMACGKTVVTTPIGCAGLDLEDGLNAFIRQDWAGFADAICAALSNAHLRTAVGLRARKTVEERFSWEGIARSAYSSYLGLAAASDEWRKRKAR